MPRTGCTLCINLFDKFRLNIDWNNHYVKPKYQTNNNYIISIRNSIDRFISAFYYDKHGKQTNYHKNFFTLCPEVDDLVKNINKSEVTKYIRLSHHLNEGLSSFFKIKHIKKTPPLYVFEFSSLHKDIHSFLRVFDIFDKKKLIIFYLKILEVVQIKKN